MYGFIVVFGHDRWRVIKIAELDVEIVDWRLIILGAEVGSRARDVARVRLLHGELACRSPLLFVCREEFRPGEPLQNQDAVQEFLARVR